MLNDLANEKIQEQVALSHRKGCMKRIWIQIFYNYPPNRICEEVSMYGVLKPP